MAREPVGSDALLGTQIGSWRLTRLIGAGGMGRVYQAVQPAIGARVAVKVLKDAAEPELVERFFNEARAVNLIRHEGIVDVIDLGRLPSGAPYIVMEFLDGASLRTLVKRTPIGAVARIMGDVLAALAAAHAKGIIHRDLKPDNVFVSPSGRVTVLDFGVAKLAGDGITQTRTGGLLGTPAYMSPEQARSQPLDARSDLYACGVILYEATTGTLPFSAPSLYELLDQHVKSAPVAPRTIAPELPVALEAVILRALAKDPADRFASASEMQQALAAAVGDLAKSDQLPTITSAPRVDVSGPGAVTQATEGGTDSLAYAATRASGERPGATPARSIAPPTEPDRGVRVSRGVVAVMAGSALLGLGAVAFVVLANRDHATEVTPRDAPIPIVPMVIDPPPVVDAAPPVVDAAPDAAAPVDAAVAPRLVKPAPRPDLIKGPLALTVNWKSFDPFAYYKTALAKAEWAAGGKVRPSSITWREFDRRGRIDLTGTGSARYLFATVDDRPDGYCYFFVVFEQGKGHLSTGQDSDRGKCTGNIGPPRCSIAQLWERAIAAGAPADAASGTANLIGRRWAFSVPGESGARFIVNDCQ